MGFDHDINRNSGKVGFGFICPVVWLCYGSLSLAQLGACDVSRRVEVGAVRG